MGCLRYKVVGRRCETGSYHQVATRTHLRGVNGWQLLVKVSFAECAKLWHARLNARVSCGLRVRITLHRPSLGVLGILFSTLFFLSLRDKWGNVRKHFHQFALSSSFLELLASSLDWPRQYFTNYLLSLVKFFLPVLSWHDEHLMVTPRTQSNVFWWKAYAITTAFKWLRKIRELLENCYRILWWIKICCGSVRSEYISEVRFLYAHLNSMIDFLIFFLIISNLAWTLFMITKQFGNIWVKKLVWNYVCLPIFVQWMVGSLNRKKMHWELYLSRISVRYLIILVFIYFFYRKLAFSLKIC